ncbi:MAG: PAS domain-containing protein, partial [Chloroflexota bacterium]
MLNLHPPYSPTAYAQFAFWEADIQTLNYTYISPEAEELFGYPLSAWQQYPDFWLERVHPEDRAQVEADLWRSIGVNRRFSLRYRWQLANGRWVWLEDWVQVVRGSEQQDKLLGTKQIQSYVNASLAKQAADVSDVIDFINQHLFVRGTFQERLANSLNMLGNQLRLQAICILENRFDEGALAATCQYRWGTVPDAFNEVSYSAIRLETAVSQLMQGKTVQSSVKLEDSEQAAVVAPIINNEIWHGSIICLASENKREWLPLELEAVAVLAHLLSTAFRNVRSYEQTQQQLFETTEQLEEAETLNEVAAHLNSAIALDEILHKTVDVLRRYLADVQSCGLTILESAGQVMRMRAQWLEKSEYALIPLGGARPVSATYVSQEVLQSQETIAVSNLRELDFEDQNARTVVERGLTSILYVPIVSQNMPVGLIHINSWHKTRQFTQREIALCEAVANQTAVAIERANLYERLQIHVNHLAEEVAERTVELKAERDRSLAVLENAGEGILVTDVDTKITYVNPAIEYQTGYSRDELIGELPTKLLSEQASRQSLERMTHTIQAGELWSGELVGRRKNGSLYDVNLTITPTRDADGNINSFVGVQADISRLKEIDRLKSEFVSNVSHELRTPLTNIKTYLSLLERGKRE